MLSIVASYTTTYYEHAVVQGTDELHGFHTMSHFLYPLHFVYPLDDK